jgi:hypothetical protein
MFAHAISSLRWYFNQNRDGYCAAAILATCLIVPFVSLSASMMPR